MRNTERNLRASRAHLAAGLKERRHLNVISTTPPSSASSCCGSSSTSLSSGRETRPRAACSGSSAMTSRRRSTACARSGTGCTRRSSGSGARHRPARGAADGGGRTALVAVGVERSRTDIEAAVYVCCREVLDVLTNGAGPVTDATLTLESRGTWLRVHFAGDTPAPAAGVRGARGRGDARSRRGARRTGGRGGRGRRPLGYNRLRAVAAVVGRLIGHGSLDGRASSWGRRDPDTAADRLDPVADVGQARPAARPLELEAAPVVAHLEGDATACWLQRDRRARARSGVLDRVLHRL